MNNESLEIRGAFVVTGAGSGIGFAAVKNLIKKGKKVYACDINLSQIEEFIKNSESSIRDRCIPVILDVTKQNNVDQLIAIIRNNEDTIYGLVNCAGIAIAAPITDLESNQLELIFQINVFGMQRMIKACFPFLLETKGRIVNMSSLSGLMTFPFMGPYSMSKHAVEALSNALRREVTRFGIKVIIIEPGKIITPLLQKSALMSIEGLSKVNPIYRERAKRMAKFDAQRVKTNALPVEMVVNLINKGLFDENPKTNYLLVKNTLKTKIMLKLPAKKFDSMMEKI